MADPQTSDETIAERGTTLVDGCEDGEPSEVAQHVMGVLDALAVFDGGLIGWGEIGPDVSVENVQAMVRAYAEWRGQ